MTNMKKCNRESSSLTPICTAFQPFCEFNNNITTLFVSMKKGAFTLAEVLITLGIIGVVAAMTIPTLMQKTNDRELVSGVLKQYSVLSNAIKQMEAVNSLNVSKLTESQFRLGLADALKSVPCGDSDTGKICLTDGSYLSLGNNVSFTEGCTQDFSDEGYAYNLKNVCVDMVIDVNGDKAPNVGGKDQFLFYVTESGLVPEGKQDDCSGFDCTNYVISTHKLWGGELTNNASIFTPAETVDLTGQGCNKGTTTTGYRCACTTSGRVETCTWQPDN